jgi:hypothetical protein
MAKVLVFIGLIFSFIASGSNTSRNAVKVVYTSQIGVREATGSNDGKVVESYLKVTGLSKGYAWCAAFVSWTFEKAGVKAIKSAYSPSWFPRNKTIWKQGKGSQPQQGDVFGIWFSNKNRIAHVGFVDSWGAKEVITVEGNTNEAGSREGDGVYKKRRLIRQIYAVSNWITR